MGYLLGKCLRKHQAVIWLFPKLLWMDKVSSLFSVSPFPVFLPQMIAVWGSRVPWKLLMCIESSREYREVSCLSWGLLWRLRWGCSGDGGARWASHQSPQGKVLVHSGSFLVLSEIIFSDSDETKQVGPWWLWHWQTQERLSSGHQALCTGTSGGGISDGPRWADSQAPQGLMVLVPPCSQNGSVMQQHGSWGEGSE